MDIVTKSKVYYAYWRTKWGAVPGREKPFIILNGFSFPIMSLCSHNQPDWEWEAVLVSFSVGIFCMK